MKIPLIEKFLNKGWRRISSIQNYEKEYSFYLLPTIGYYDVVVDKKIVYRYYYGGSISDDIYVENNVTHFRKSPNHDFPIF